MKLEDKIENEERREAEEETSFSAADISLVLGRMAAFAQKTKSRREELAELYASAEGDSIFTVRDRYIQALKAEGKSELEAILTADAELCL